jgi:pimeloyl-ACP methyl ester carboxylesterase
MKYGLVNRAFNVTDENVASYMSALEAAIINQTSLDDIKTLHVPIRIIRGSLDPVLVSSRIKRLAKDQPNIAVLTILAGHEVRGRFAKKVVEEIVATLQQQ